MMWGYNGFGGGLMGIGMLLFWGLVVFAIVMAVRGFAGGCRSVSRETGTRDKTALDILAERYARGEIDKTEFEQKRADLRAP